MSSIILRPEAVRSNHLPFAALPHALNEDPRLTPRAVRVAAAALKHARDRASCYPSNRTLAAACCCSIRTVQYALAELRAAGWIRIERGPAGRVLRLAWREPPPCNGLHPKEKAGEGDRHNVTDLPPPEDAAASPRMPREPRPGPAPAPRPSAPVRPLRDELKGLPGADAPHVRSLAWRLAHHLKDLASVGFFIMALGLVAQRLTPVERLLAAFVVADRARDKARKPGAIFASAWSSWTPPPLPSEINRPTYYQAPRPPTAPPPEPSAPPPPEPPTLQPPEPEVSPPGPAPADIVRQWETWALLPGHFLRDLARRNLAAYHAEAARTAQEPRHGTAALRDDRSHVGAAGIGLEAVTPAEQGPPPGAAPRA